MRDSDEKKCKKQELINNFDFTEASLKQAEDYFQTKNIPFVAKENTTFTFIDLFAGIGGFRLAMQANGGECVFSSEWDKDAKQTYYENYGEVPFGDITKDEVDSFIKENLREDNMVISKVTEKTNNIYVPIITHALNNLIAVIIVMII